MSEIKTHMYTERERERERERETDRQTERQTDRQTDRDREKVLDIEKKKSRGKKKIERPQSVLCLNYFLWNKQQWIIHQSWRPVK